MARRSIDGYYIKKEERDEGLYKDSGSDREMTDEEIRDAVKEAMEAVPEDTENDVSFYRERREYDVIYDEEKDDYLNAMDLLVRNENIFSKKRTIIV